MVFESLVLPSQAESKPVEMLIYGMLITSVSILVAYYIFPSQASLVFLFFVTLASVPTVAKILQDEEEVDENEERLNINFFKRYGRIVEIYGFLFLGIVFATSFWFTALPGTVSDTLFSNQINTIESINGNVGRATLGGSFDAIFQNNFRVAFIAFIASFFFGTGGLFIIAWNASVIGVFTSLVAKQFSNTYMYPLFFGHIDALLSIAIHGIPEIAAYFIAAIAGGILSIGLIKGKHDIRIIKDSFLMFGICTVILIGAAAIEAYITPIL